MWLDDTSGARGGQNDPFGEDFFLAPYADEIRERARMVRSHNQDALRHFVEVVAWEAFDQPELRRHLVPLLLLLNDVKLHWISEPLCMDVRDVCAAVEANPIMAFNCLDCGAELPVEDRNRMMLMNDSSKALSEDLPIDKGHLDNLLCHFCKDRRRKAEEEQRLLDQLRLQALLAEYRKGSYAERRKSEEWSILKRWIHSRDGYRCRMCGRSKVELHLHHCSYDNYGEERLEDLITVCSVCHYRHHFPPGLSEAS